MAVVSQKVRGLNFKKLAGLSTWTVHTYNIPRSSHSYAFSRGVGRRPPPLQTIQYTQIYWPHEKKKNRIKPTNVNKFTWCNLCCLTTFNHRILFDAFVYSWYFIVFFICFIYIALKRTIFWSTRCLSHVEPCSYIESRETPGGQLIGI